MHDEANAFLSVTIMLILLLCGTVDFLLEQQPIEQLPNPHFPLLTYFTVSDKKRQSFF